MAEAFGDLLAEHGIGGGLADRLVRYLELLERWGRTHNLVRFGSRRELVERHVVESLAGVGALDRAGGLLVDVGSGAGLPGVPLLAAAAAWRGLLIEPRRKRWAFLRTVVRELGLDAEVVDRRYQEVEVNGAGSIVSRATGRYGELVAWARPRLAPGGRVLLWLGEGEAGEVESLDGWRVVTSPLPGLDRGRLAVMEPCFT
ncbi:MAG TPA: 16S rRNA (guanine(527)-N(7))-methyltransferase RsmG [Acidobacteria bacterium]|nr:16S rRNA (guanine(527)-N(7))-methyltransferase RsmG [Acidobacteriota bacterium]